MLHSKGIKMGRKDNVLEVENLRTEFKVGKKTVHAVNDVSFSLKRGETLGIVGESGCGKSVTANSIMQLIPPNGYIANGSIKYYPTIGSKPKILTSYKRNGKEIRGIRGKDIAQIFQDPMTSLNPVYSIGYQIMENLLNHEDVSKEEGKKRIIKLLSELGISAPEQRYNEYPYQFSGGMKQRVMIAIAMICNPNILIADEPTTALDVTIQAQILRLMKQLQDAFGTSIILITHNIGIVASVCDSVAVMYLGRIVEYGSVRQVFKNPKHPYTKALMRSVPVLGMDRDKELMSIEGQTPDASIYFDHCEFEPRCDMACDFCKRGFPKPIEIEPGHIVRCFLFEREEIKQ